MQQGYTLNSLNQMAQRRLGNNRRLGTRTTGGAGYPSASEPSMSSGSPQSTGLYVPPPPDYSSPLPIIPQPPSPTSSPPPVSPPSGGGGGGGGNNPLPAINWVADKAWLMQDPEFAAYMARFNDETDLARQSRLTALNNLRLARRSETGDYRNARREALRDVQSQNEGSGMLLSGSYGQQRAETAADIDREYNQYLDSYHQNVYNERERFMQDYASRIHDLILEQIAASQRLTQQSIQANQPV